MKVIIEERLEGSGGLDRRKHSWLKDLRNWTGLASHSLFRAAPSLEDSIIRKIIIHHVCEPIREYCK